jgi:hypothetical protein
MGRWVVMAFWISLISASKVRRRSVKLLMSPAVSIASISLHCRFRPASRLFLLAAWKTFLSVMSRQPCVFLILGHSRAKQGSRPNASFVPFLRFMFDRKTRHFAPALRNFATRPAPFSKRTFARIPPPKECGEEDAGVQSEACRVTPLRLSILYAAASGCGDMEFNWTICFLMLVASAACSRVRSSCCQDPQATGDDTAESSLWV